MDFDWLHIEQTHNVVVVTIASESLNEQRGLELVQEIANRVRYHGGHYFVLDMTLVQLISSACLGALVNLLQDLEHVRGRIVLAKCNHDVAMLFKLTRLDALVGLYDSVAEARAKVKHAS